MKAFAGYAIKKYRIILASYVGLSMGEMGYVRHEE